MFRLLLSKVKQDYLWKKLFCLTISKQSLNKAGAKKLINPLLML